MKRVILIDTETTSMEETGMLGKALVQLPRNHFVRFG
jgi:hypothetical protein